MIKKGIVVTAIFVIATFVQLISQIIITRIYGATVNLDIFLAAVTVPTIIITIIYANLNDAFLPLYGDEKNKHPESADGYFFSHLVILGFLSFIIALVFNFASLPVSKLLYSSRGDQFVEQVATQMNFMFYSIPLAAISTILGSYFYSKKDFLRFPLAQLGGSLANLFLIIILQPYLGIWSLVTAFVLNIVFQIALVIPNSIKNIQIKFVNVIPVVYTLIPLVIGSFALRSDMLLIRSFGSQLPEGYLVHLNLISKIFSLSTSVMTIGIQIILLPHLVEYFSSKQYEKAFKNVTQAKLIAVGISIVVSMTVALLTPLAIQILFVGGKFNVQDAETTISLLPYFILPAIGWGINSVFFQPLIALKKQVQLGAINVVALAVAWVSASLANQYAGPLGAILTGLIVLLFTGIIGSELLWQYYKRKLTS